MEPVVPIPDMPIHRVFALTPRSPGVILDTAEATVAWLVAGWELSPALAQDAYDHLDRIRCDIATANAVI